MIEVEVKIKINDVQTVKSKLINLGFIEYDTIKESDTYFDNVNGDIRRGDRALRVRETVNTITNETYCQINFKDKKYDNKSMTRPEFETEISDADAILHILGSLGYHPVEPRVIKLRREFKKANMNACIDTVENLGDYLELEIITEAPDQKDQELAKIEHILLELGYDMSDTTTTSYLTALQNLNLNT